MSTGIEELEVEEILKMRKRNGITKYFLKWTGFDYTRNSWEPESNLHCDELLKNFKNNLIRDEKKEKTKKKKNCNRRKCYITNLIVVNKLASDAESSIEPMFRDISTIKTKQR